LISEHADRTDSPVARRVLADWDGLLARGAFVKVMPRDYRRVLAELAEEERAAADASGNGATTPIQQLDAVGAPLGDSDEKPL
jgi:glutamate synthase domain-containing protein 3